MNIPANLPICCGRITCIYKSFVIATPLADEAIYYSEDHFAALVMTVTNVIAIPALAGEAIFQ